METMPGDAGAERAVLSIIFSLNDKQTLSELEPEDFYNPDCRFIFEEMRAMTESLYPLDDPIAAARWFCQERCKDRAKAAGIKEGVAGLAAELLGAFVPLTSLQFHIRALRKERMSRQLKWVALQINERVAKTPDNPFAVLVWANNVFEQVYDLAYRSFPELSEVD